MYLQFLNYPGKYFHAVFIVSYKYSSIQASGVNTFNALSSVLHGQHHTEKNRNYITVHNAYIYDKLG